MDLRRKQFFMFFSDFFQKQRANVKSDIKFTPEEEGTFISKYFKKYFDGASSVKSPKRKAVQSDPTDYSIYKLKSKPNAFNIELMNSQLDKLLLEKK